MPRRQPRDADAGALDPAPRPHPILGAGADLLALCRALETFGFHPWVYEPRRRGSLVSPGVFMLLGLAPRPDGWLAAAVWYQRVVAADRPRIRAQAAAMWKGVPQHFQYRIVGSTRARTRWVDVFAIPLPSVRGGAGRRAIGFMRAAREDLGHAERRVATSRFALDVAGVVHDLNGAFQAMVTNAELVVAASPATTAATAGDRILRAVGRGVAILGRLQAPPEARHRRAEAPESLGAILRAVREDIRLRVGSAVDIRLRIDAGVADIEIPAAEFETALLNILDNAHEAMPGGGRILVRARRVQGGCADWLTIDVADDGPGMDVTTLRRAFDPFFTTKPAGKGTGLGLTLARELAERYRGSLALQSAPGQGTRATLRLPLPFAAVVDAVLTPSRRASPAAADGRSAPGSFPARPTSAR